ncbi:hypothetical protein [Nostoc sp. MG11]|uniref:hypothetical protein n=1 Tax=Nostoc sp. MG11 TaxID=2721166 RepID=UPI001D02C6E5|nr:hypothetical protein [Nostoc sp. MG11]
MKNVASSFYYCEYFLICPEKLRFSPLASDKTIDGDIILVAQAVTLAVLDVVIATTNVGHLSRFVSADLWQNIKTS